MLRIAKQLRENAWKYFVETWKAAPVSVALGTFMILALFGVALYIRLFADTLWKVFVPLAVWFGFYILTIQLGIAFDLYRIDK